MPGPGLRIAATIYAALLVVLLLWPEPVEQVLKLNFGRGHDAAEQIANVLIFIPIGYGLAWWLYSRWGAVVVGIFVSLAVEVAQLLWLPQRDASARDVLLNAIGTTLGALLYRRPPGPEAGSGRSRTQ
jgi:glycopeptide antibiotics resistance protein